MNAAFISEELNGIWAISALSLIVICSLYLKHELSARHILPFGDRTRLTDGIKIAIATLTMSTGVFIRSGEAWRWRVFGGDLDQIHLMVGGIIGVIGFLCLIREKSAPLFGRGPWMITLGLIVIFLIVSAIHRF